ncbi:restriction endonuclease subunit S [Streptococcus thermophilus]|nr:restriction endonuclease subunit S [Streptococcus thermophilus]MCE2184060.1 restriction endonuclease subunit S [Streptococcus thermophilus]
MPLIRISQHRGQWLYRKLLEVKDVRDGTHSSPKYIDNGYPLVTSKNLTDSGLSLNDVSLISESDYNEINKRSKVEVGDILLGLIGTIGKPVLVDSDGFAIKNVGLIKNGGQIQNQFLLQYLKTNLFNKYIQIEMAGNTQKFLGLETLRNTRVPVPSQDEQSAIGSLFRTLDDLLASYKDNLANYQSLKATMLSKMFPKAGQTVPEIRLEGFEGEWVEKRLKDVSKRVTRKNNDLVSERALTISAQFGLIDQEEFFQKKIASKDVSGYYLIKKGEFAYNKSYSTGYPLGAIKRLDNYENGVLSTLYILFKAVDVDSDYLAHYYESDKWHREVSMCAAEGARNHGLLNIAPADFFNTRLVIPKELDEQRAIGSYFSNLDNLISSYQEKISHLETLKKKLLQDMFI